MALLGALVFAVHPICTEPVNYISSRATLMAAVGLCGAFLLYMRGGRYYWAAPVVYIFGLLSKESAIVLPALLFIFDYCQERINRKTVTRYIPFGLLSAAYLWHTWSLTGFLEKAVAGAPVRTWDLQIATQIKALVYYAKLLFMPTGLNVHHGFVVSYPAAPVALAGFALTLSLGWWGWRQQQYRASLGFGLAWALICLAPTLFVPLNILVNEHRLYLPLVGLVIILSRLPRLERVPGLIWGAPLLIVLMGVTTWQRNQVWANEATLWADATAKAPLESRPYIYLGNSLHANGEHGAAVEQFNHALRLEPDNLSARNNIGLAYLNLNQLALAQDQFNQLLVIYPGLNEAHYNLGKVAEQAKDWPKALQHYAKVDTSSQHSALLLNSMGTVYERIGRLDSALLYYHKAIKRQPGLKEASNNLARHRQQLPAIGESLFLTGKAALVEAWCFQFLQLEPTHKEALFFMSVSLFHQGRLQESIVVNRRLVEVYPEDYHGRLQLANVLEGNGQWEDARQQYEFLIKNYNDPDARERVLRLQEKMAP